MHALQQWQILIHVVKLYGHMPTIGGSALQSDDEWNCAIGTGSFVSEGSA